ncbi:MAG: helix-turn-helix transcriptional regulator [Erysipelotrichales bacterium]|nr:helix-turn-helix transcriptional regulator [Erysipelotrichales bacterium]
MEKENLDCPVSATLNLIGGKYKALILWHLMDKTIRFSELRKMIPSATSKMLTQQLRELESSELLIRKVYPIVPPKVEYSLTEKGKSLEPILNAMFQWGTKIMQAKGKSPNCSMTRN